MKNVTPILWIMIICISFASCKSTKKAYKKGDYETAVFNSIDRLRKSPNNKKARETLKLAYSDLSADLLKQVANARKSPDPFRFESIVDHYSVLTRIYREVQRAPGAKRILTSVKDYSSDLNSAKLKAAEVRYAQGERALAQAMEEGDREIAKQAFFHFQKADNYQPGFRSSRAKMEDARAYATLFIKIDPIPMHSRTLSLTNEFFENQMTEYIRSHPTSEFIQFVSARQDMPEDRVPDQIIRMIFDDFVVGQSYIKEKVIERTRDSVVVGSVEIKPDSTADVYGTVKAEVHQFQKEITSSGLLDMQIIDGRTGELLTQRKFPGTFIWYDKWGFFNGDKRAITEEDKDFTRKRKESREPLPQDLFIEFTKPIFTQVTGFVTEYYRNY